MFRVGLENNTECRSLAWVLGHPGCFAFGVDGTAALQAVPVAISDYRRWISDHTPDNWLPANEDEFVLEETFECYTINDDFEFEQAGYEVNAWFRHDWKPLTLEEIKRGLKLLDWGREELLRTVDSLPPHILDRTYPGERWSIRGILSHIAVGEWWYLDRLGLVSPGEALPKDAFESLEKGRASLVNALPGLAGSTRVVGLDGEIWSPRKLLRRAAWHEYDHIAHIRKLL